MKQHLRLGRNHRLIRKSETAPITDWEMTEANMKMKWITLALALAFMAAGTLAHGNKVHVKGRVEKVSPDSLQVKTSDGKSVEVKLSAVESNKVASTGAKPKS